MTDVDAGACAAAYSDLRARVTALVRDADPALIAAIAPATPEWRVHDVLAHVSGVNADIVSGTLDGVGTDAWTAVQVEIRRTWSVDDILLEWAEHGATVESIAPQLGPAVGQWLFDACTHEHDIRHALDAPGARDSDAVALGFWWVTDMLGSTTAPALVLETDGDARTIGTGEPASRVRTSRFEVMRALSGRRSRAQVEAYAWEGSPRPEALASRRFGLRADDFVE